MKTGKKRFESGRARHISIHCVRGRTYQELHAPRHGHRGTKMHVDAEHKQATEWCMTEYSTEYSILYLRAASKKSPGPSLGRRLLQRGSGWAEVVEGGWHGCLMAVRRGVLGRS